MKKRKRLRWKRDRKREKKMMQECERVRSRKGVDWTQREGCARRYEKGWVREGWC